MSFRKAGELLNLTQPAVSAQIKSLEDEFKTVLIDRNQPVTLTDRGQVFLEHAERILAHRGGTQNEAVRSGPDAAGAFRARDDLLDRHSDFAAGAVLFSKPISAHQDHHSFHVLFRRLPSVENGSVDIGITLPDREEPARGNLDSVLRHVRALVVAPDHPHDVGSES